MKKILIAFSSVALLGMLALSSCKKDENLITNSTGQTEQLQQISMGVSTSWVWEWDEWGRKKKLCDGGGLCNFRRVEKTTPATEKSSYIYENPDGTLYVIVAIDNDFNFEDATQRLYIDEDIYHIGDDGATCKVDMGAYEYDSSLGTIGGYIVPITIY